MVTIEIFNDKKLTHLALANKFGVTESTISAIKNGRSWKYLNLKQGEEKK